MPKVLVLDYKKCRPGCCPDGLCASALACPLGVIGQESPFEIPMQYSPICKGCMKCVKVCPLQAVGLQ